MKRGDSSFSMLLRKLYGFFSKKIRKFMVKKYKYEYIPNTFHVHVCHREIYDIYIVSM